MTDYTTLDHLHRELAQCRACAEAGYTILSEPVFAGEAAARVMLVGQAPGKEEGESGQPFSGPSGTRLFQWLRRAGWHEADFRAAAYITAVTKCFPGPNPKGEGDRRASAAERELCRPWLDAELALVQPELILPVGSLAVKLFYPSQSRLRDVVGESMVDDAGRHILPLPHPSGASRWLNNPMNAGRLEQALYRLKTLKGQLNL